jgi:hypothetical protein
MPCLVQGCENPHHSKGFCGAHYQRMRRFGSPVVVPAYVAGRPKLYDKQVAVMLEISDDEFLIKQSRLRGISKAELLRQYIAKGIIDDEDRDRNETAPVARGVQRDREERPRA